MDINQITGNLSDARFIPSNGVALPIAITEIHTCYNYPQHGNKIGFYLHELPYMMLKVERDDGVIYKEMEVNAVLGDLNFAVRKDGHNLGFLWFGDASLEGRRFTVKYQGLGRISHVENILYNMDPPLMTLVESPKNNASWIATFKVNTNVDIWVTGQGGKGSNGSNGGSVSSYGSGSSGGTGAYGMKLDKCKIQLTNGTYIIKSQLISTQKGATGGTATAINTSGGAGGAGGAAGRSIGIQRSTINSNSNVDALQYILLIYGGSGGGGGGGGGGSGSNGGKGGSSTEITAFNSYFLALGGGILGYSAPSAPSGMNGTAGQRAPVFGSSATTSDYWIKIEARAIDIVKNNITLI